MASAAPAAVAAAPHAPRHLPRFTRADLPIFVGLTIVLGLYLAALFAPLPYSPTAPDPAGSVLAAPSSEHWFGTDATGYDVFSRVIASAKRDLPLAVLGTLVSLLIGVPLGLLASSKGKM